MHGLVESQPQKHRTLGSSLSMSAFSNLNLDSKPIYAAQPITRKMIAIGLAKRRSHLQSATSLSLLNLLQAKSGWKFNLRWFRLPNPFSRLQTAKIHFLPKPRPSQQASTMAILFAWHDWPNPYLNSDHACTCFRSLTSLGFLCFAQRRAACPTKLRGHTNITNG